MVTFPGPSGPLLWTRGAAAQRQHAASFCIESVLYWLATVHKSDLITEFPLLLPGCHRVTYLQRRPCPLGQTVPYNWLSDWNPATDTCFLDTTRQSPWEGCLPRVRTDGTCSHNATPASHLSFRDIPEGNTAILKLASPIKPYVKSRLCP